MYYKQILMLFKAHVLAARVLLSVTDKTKQKQRIREL